MLKNSIGDALGLHLLDCLRCLSRGFRYLIYWPETKVSSLGVTSKSKAKVCVLTVLITFFTSLSQSEGKAKF